MSCADVVVVRVMDDEVEDGFTSYDLPTGSTVGDVLRKHKGTFDISKYQVKLNRRELTNGLDTPLTAGPNGSAPVISFTATNMKAAKKKA